MNNDTLMIPIPLEKLFSDQIIDSIAEKIVSKLPPVAAPVEIIDGCELCKRLDISEPTLRAWRKRKKIPSIVLCGIVRFNWTSVVETLEKNRK